MTEPVLPPQPAPPAEAPIPERLYHQLQQWGVSLPGARTAVLGSRNGRVSAALTRLGARVVSVMEKPAASIAGNREGLLLVQGPPDRPPLRRLAFDLLVACNRAPQLCASRALVPGGWLVLAGFQWLPSAHGPGRAAEACLDKYGLEPSSGESNGVHPSWLRFLQASGMESIVSSSVDLDVAFDSPTWRSAVHAEAHRRGSLTIDDWKRFNADLDSGLEECFPAELASVPHRLFVTAGRRSWNPA